MSPTQLPPAKGRGPKLTSALAQARLSDALRENLLRRKAQMRARDNAKETAADDAGAEEELDNSGKGGGKTR